MLNILFSEGLKEYDFGPGHPFRGDRFEIFPPFLKANMPEGVESRIVGAEPVGEADLRMICRDDYIAFCREYYRAANLGLPLPGNRLKYLSQDNVPIGQPGRLEEAARLAVGQTKLAADIALERDSEKVIVLGAGLHHAKAGYGEGFCIYNDVAFCAAYLRSVHKLDRVLVLDTDAHGGNGTAEYFYEDASVLFIDLHQDPATLYPGTGFAGQIGDGEGRGFTVNIPMPPLSGQGAYALAFEEIVRPVAEEFRPQIIIRNGGSDPHFGDELTRLGLGVAGFRMIGETVREMAEICGGREIDMIGSGYNRTVLPYAWMALLCGVAGIEIDLEEPEPVPGWLSADRSLDDIRDVISQVKGSLKDYWRCLS